MKRQITSNRLNVNAGIMSWYVKSLEKLAKEMGKECRERLSEIYRELSPQISGAIARSIQNNEDILFLLYYPP